MSIAANVTANQNIQQFQHSTILSAAEIDVLLAKLARGHLSTMQEEYADLKKVLCQPVRFGC